MTSISYQFLPHVLCQVFNSMLVAFSHSLEGPLRHHSYTADV